MVGTLGKGSASERSISVAMHISAAALTAAFFGWILSLIAALMPVLLLAAVASSIFLLYGSAELGWLTLPLPETGKQVPQAWRYRFPQPVAAFLYGAFLGPGLGTRIPSPSYVCLLGLVAWLHEPLLGACIMAGYGFTRATMSSFLAQVERTEPLLGISLGLAVGRVLPFPSAILDFVIGGVLLMSFR